MQNSDVARCFDELADLLEIDGANPFRVRAYRNAARTIDSLAESVADIAEDPDRDLDDLPGIGKDLAGKIVKILETGTLPDLEDLRKRIPAGVVEMMRLPSVGPKRAATLFQELSVRSLEDLKHAAEQGKIAELKGFGKKTQQSILENVEQAAEAEKRFSLSEAKSEVEAILEGLRGLESVDQAAVAGSYRRRRETVGDLDVLVTSSNPKEVMNWLAHSDRVTKVLLGGETKQRVRLRPGIEMDVRVVADECYGAALQYFTGSQAHNIAIRRRAQDRTLKISEYGVFKGEKLVAGRTEEDVYEAVDLPWIPPELRENRGEIERAEKGKLPTLIALEDIRGDLHMHTTATDGTASIETMAEAARARGLKYIAITDHSKRVRMANGLDADRLRKHWKEIETIRKKVSGIEILKGIECDILEDATLDLPDDVLSEADWVVAVLHYGLKQPQAQITKRLLTAIQNPNVSIIGHPTGRIVGKRPGADVAFDEIFKAAADHQVMMEINANPQRLDLDDIHAAAAAYDYGIPIVISTDAHSTGNLALMEYGVDQARRAGLEKKHVANTKTPAQFRKLLRRS